MRSTQAVRVPMLPHRCLRALGAAVVAYFALTCAAGCVSWPANWNVFNRPKPPPPPGPTDSFVLRGDQLERDPHAIDGPLTTELAGARQLYDQAKYAEARPIFAGIANNTKAPAQIAEEACYYEADCLRLLGEYPNAGDTYIKLLNAFPSTRFGNLARRHLYDIANYWLDSTRVEMTKFKSDDIQRVLYQVGNFMHFEKTKPLTDMEGHALRYLEQVHITDPGGPLGDKAYFLVGSVRFYREDWTAADHYFYEIVKNYPRSEHAEEALELSIICKQMATGGSEYDGRKVAEARELINLAQASFPKLANERKEFFTNQLASISLQQADKDWGFAEFYRRQGHPASAYFYYEIVMRRYPGTKYAQKAKEQKDRLEAELNRRAPPEQPRPGAQIGAVPPTLTPGMELGPAPGVLPPALTGPRQ